jgi:hypothetical protein
MTIKITEKLREQAALICLVEASMPDLCGESKTTADALGFSEDAAQLAAASALPLYTGGSTPTIGCGFDWRMHAAYAEAAELLREGHVPKRDDGMEFIDWS